MRNMSKEEQEQRIGTEVIQSHHLMKWVLGAVAANLAVFLVGGISIWVNDEKQDEKLHKHDVQIESKQSKDEAALLKELLEVKILANSKTGDDIKQILFRMEDDIKAIREQDRQQHMIWEKQGIVK